MNSLRRRPWTRFTYLERESEPLGSQPLCSCWLLQWAKASFGLRWDYTTWTCTFPCEKPNRRFSNNPAPTRFPNRSSCGVSFISVMKMYRLIGTFSPCPKLSFGQISIPFLSNPLYRLVVWGSVRGLWWLLGSPWVVRHLRILELRLGVGDIGLTDGELARYGSDWGERLLLLL